MTKDYCGIVQVNPEDFEVSKASEGLVKEIAGIIAEKIYPLEHVTLTKPDVTRLHNAARATLEALSRRAAGDDATERAEIVSILRERCDQDFDGECHLTNAEADRIITALTNTSDEGVLP